MHRRVALPRCNPLPTMTGMPRLSSTPAARRHRAFMLVLLLAAPLGSPAQEPIPPAALADARRASAELVASIRGELVKAIEASGPLRAIIVCKYTVPEVASAVSRKYGARVTRVSLTPRNPALGWGDAWEQRVLLDFDQRVARGEKPDDMESAEIVAEPTGRFVRYMKALPMIPACMHCHGPADQISESIRQQLAHDYPHDQATGVGLGKVRGAVSYKKPL